ncbi:TPA: hypothetical protein DIV48_00645 [Candidatus Kaiserbacteria bacterium]|nr:MAG: hypothetical protein UY93_C0003G0036 [Parcubacteria group bacterium GW2011_GWA1_56_13]KKW45777.1 MAG: hypothetical protein UY97_C0015G0004 [Parcubacteria group bacterium GW2011_GWB1_57_6]HCR52140.1 hypothetical protein [Candidatus Kaiserbacteria bacterium]
MQRALLIPLILILLPMNSHAARAPATFSASRSVLVSDSSAGNMYAGGASIVITAPVGGDLSAAGGSVVTAAPVEGDGLLLAGSVSVRAPVGGDLRIAGGSVNIETPVAGDLVAFGLSANSLGRVSGNTLIVAANTTIAQGASGPVVIYGNNISLAGDFADDVTIMAWGRVALTASTTIRGALTYEAPMEALIPASARILGGVKYTNASYLPDAGTSRILSLISIGFFLLIRILGALILAGLFAGLFPKFADAMAQRAFSAPPRSILLTVLLGIAAFVVTPVFFLLLALTFVGMGLALLFFIAYALIVFLSLIYAGILLGSFFARRFMGRDSVLWHDGVLGMLALSVIALVPYVGVFIVLLFMAFSAGALLLMFFQFAFPHDGTASELL